MRFLLLIARFLYFSRLQALLLRKKTKSWPTWLAAA